MPDITYTPAEVADRQQRYKNWRTAIGLQEVDNLKPSPYLTSLAEEHIEGKKTIAEIETLINAYYKDGEGRNLAKENRFDEADIVATRITKLLDTKTFTLATSSLKSIHKKLFSGFKEYAPGVYRNYNIIKEEWVLDGDTVQYGDYDILEEDIRETIKAEQNFSYSELKDADLIKHITGFVSDIWVLHAFLEGNTRTTAIFIIKYLRSIGFDVDNRPFEENSRYFRNALVRANYWNGVRKIDKNTLFIERFFENLLTGSAHVLKNRELSVLWNDKMREVSPGVYSDEASGIVSRETNGDVTVNVTVKILEQMKLNSKITVDEIAEEFNINRRTVLRHIKQLREQNKLTREGSDKTGNWVVLSDESLRR
jgi:fido (protein-threonine AMPylation protein)